MYNTIDQIGQEISLARYPKRIISLVPSQTELLYDLGLVQETIGITRFCIHPETWFHSKKRIGGTKDLHLDKIKALQPDLVIANKEENILAQVEQIRQFCLVWTSDISNLSSALDMIREVSRITNRTEAGLSLVQEIEYRFSDLLTISVPESAVYLIWKDPYMTVGGDTFINNMMRICGLRNAFEQSSRYPQTTISEIARLNPRFLLLSSEPYPFKDNHVNELTRQLPGIKIILADGEMFSWYGSRLLHSAAYFNELRKQL
jgi:ABC-type Fe3+-hydroxamate transport system substrate-binding protein